MQPFYSAGAVSLQRDHRRLHRRGFLEPRGFVRRGLASDASDLSCRLRRGRDQSYRIFRAWSHRSRSRCCCAGPCDAVGESGSCDAINSQCFNASTQAALLNAETAAAFAHAVRRGALSYELPFFVAITGMPPSAHTRTAATSSASSSSGVCAVFVVTMCYIV